MRSLSFLLCFIQVFVVLLSQGNAQLIVPLPFEWTYAHFSNCSFPAGLSGPPNPVAISDTKFAVFGGFIEAIDSRYENQFFNKLFIFDTETDTCTWVQVGDHTNSSVVPSPRAFHGLAYHATSNSLYMFGGTRYGSSLEPQDQQFFSDMWRFDLNTMQWHRLPTQTIRPSDRAAFGFSNIQNGDKIYLFGGSGNLFATYNDLWCYDIPTNSWTLLQAQNPNITTTGPGPRPLIQTYFDHRPGTSQIQLSNGEWLAFTTTPPYIRANINTQVWLMHTEPQIHWQELNTHNAPAIAREFQCHTFLSSTHYLLQGGDAQGNLTTGDVCKPPLECKIPATPTRDTFIYNLITQRYTQVSLKDNLPPLRRPLCVKMKRAVYLLGGFGWDPQVGSIPNPYVWKTEIALF